MLAPEPCQGRIGAKTQDRECLPALAGAPDEGPSSSVAGERCRARTQRSGLHRRLAAHPVLLCWRVHLRRQNGHLHQRACWRAIAAGQGQGEGADAGAALAAAVLQLLPQGGRQRLPQNNSYGDVLAQPPPRSKGGVLQCKSREERMPEIAIGVVLKEGFEGRRRREREPRWAVAASGHGGRWQ